MNKIAKVMNELGDVYKKAEMNDKLLRYVFEQALEIGKHYDITDKEFMDECFEQVLRGYKKEQTGGKFVYFLDKASFEEVFAVGESIEIREGGSQSGFNGIYIDVISEITDDGIYCETLGRSFLYSKCEFKV